MIELRTPRGLPALVPETDAEDPSPKFDRADLDGLGRYYREYGYVVVRGLYHGDRCDRLRELWAEEVKPSRAFIYRQQTARAERHAFNDKGWVMNPILNLQSVDPKRFPGFRRYAVENFLADRDNAVVLRALVGDKPKVVQSMYFEGNSATWEHQDTYYLDSESLGAMSAAWIALEDIGARAGRFFVCAGSHRIEMARQTLETNVADNHEAYIASVVDLIREKGLPIRAPKLDRGDVLFWNSRTIHGSLDSQDPDRSRASVTMHVIGASQRLLQLQSRIVPLKLTEVNDVLIHHPKDLSSCGTRVVLELESRLPTAFYAAKRCAVRAVVGRNRG